MGSVRNCVVLIQQTPLNSLFGGGGAFCWTQGCGNSELAEQLARAHGLATDADDAGGGAPAALREARGSSRVRARPPCVQVEAVDYAPRMMEHMGARASPLLGRCVLQYAVMDAQRLGFRDGAFDTVIDKGAFVYTAFTPPPCELHPTGCLAESQTPCFV